jgi:hypothetical protein
MHRMITQLDLQYPQEKNGNELEEYLLQFEFYMTVSRCMIHCQDSKEEVAKAQNCSFS